MKERIKVETERERERDFITVLTQGAVARKSILAPILLKSASRFQYSNLIGCVHTIGMRIMMSL